MHQQKHADIYNIKMRIVMNTYQIIKLTAIYPLSIKIKRGEKRMHEMKAFLPESFCENGFKFMQKIITVMHVLAFGHYCFLNVPQFSITLCANLHYKSFVMLVILIQATVQVKSDICHKLLPVLPEQVTFYSETISNVTIVFCDCLQTRFVILSLWMIYWLGK